MKKNLESTTFYSALALLTLFVPFALGLAVAVSDWQPHNLHVGVVLTLHLILVCGFLSYVTYTHSHAFSVCLFKKSIWQKLVQAMICFLLWAQLITPIYFQMLAAPFAWDGLSWWFERAVLMGADEISGTRGIYGGIFGLRHPETYPGILFLSSAIGQTLLGPQVTHFPSHIFPILSIIFASLSLMCAWSAGSGRKIICCYLVLTIPALETHASILGYVDIWLAAALMCYLTIVMQRNLGQKAGPLYAIGYQLLCLCMMVSLKSWGLALAMVAVSGALAAKYLPTPRAPALIGALCVSIATLFCLIISGVKLVSIFGKPYGLNDDGRLLLHGNPMGIPDHSILDSLVSLGHALLINATFSLTLIIWAGVLLLSCLRVLSYRAISSAIVSIGFVACLVLAVTFTNYFYQFGRPGSDTSLSRLILVLFPAFLTYLLINIDYHNLSVTDEPVRD